MTGRRLVLALLLALWPSTAAAHGAHGPGGPLGLATLGDYRVELLHDTAPLAPGQPGRLVARVSRGEPPTPVSGGRVLVGLGAPAGAPPEAAPAVELAWAGEYVAAVRPERAGPHRVRVVLAELEGRRLVPPLAVDFALTVERAPGLGPAGWLLVAALGLGGAFGLYVAGRRAWPEPAPAEAANLLEIAWLRRLLTSRAFQRSLQGLALLLTAIVIFVGFHDVQDGGLNLATKLTWTIWWAGVIFTFVLAGRVWCVACPIGALNEWTARATGAWRRLPRTFRNLWWATAAFVLLTWADEQLGVVRSPRVTAWLLVLFVVLAVAVGLAYQRRSFCRHLCPIGGLIGIYSMTAPLELRARDAATCRSHAEKGCYRGAGAGHGCPMFEFPQAMDRNNYCTLCAECVKSCARDNLVLRFRSFGRDLWATRHRALDEAYLAVALVGLTVLVTAQMLTAWPGWMAALARGLPPLVRTTLRPVTYLTLVESVALLAGALVVAPLLALAAAAAAERLAGGGRLGLRRTFVRFAYMFVPVGLAMHLAHNLSHLLLEGGAIVPAVQRAVARYTPLDLGAPDWASVPAAAPAVVHVLQAAVIAAFFVLSLVVGHRLAARSYPDSRTASRALAPFAALSFAFTVTSLALLQQPMIARHGM